MLSKNAITVLEKRYLRKDETGAVCESPQDLFRRVARTLAEIDGRYGANAAEIQATETRFYDLMVGLEFLPNSPTLANAGTRTGQLSACFVLPVPDELAGIFETCKQAALIHQTGGGTGFAFSRLRPKNDLVQSTKGVSSGPVSFMDVYNAATESIKQGGMRRGANMGILRVDHPDIMEFIRHKEDLTKLTNFNISVALTDAFMAALERDEPYQLLNPRSGEVAGTMEARAVWREILQRAWNTGEPGVVFIDRMNQYCPVPWMGQYESTNPCVTADTWVQTSEGPRQVRSLLGRAFHARVNGEDLPTGERGFFKTATKPVVALQTREGFSLRLTADHRVRKVTTNGRFQREWEWCEASSLVEGDRVLLNNHRSNASWPGAHTREQGYLLGLLVGDGTLKQDKAVLSVWHAQEVANGAAGGPSRGVAAVMQEALSAALTLPHRSDFSGWTAVAGRGESRLALGALKQMAQELGMTPGDKAITAELEQGSSEFYRGFLRGFFDADGTVTGSQEKGVSVRLSQSDLERLQAVQRMLLRLGIASKIYENRRPEGCSMLPDGHGGDRLYPTKAQHELAISGDNLARYQELIGFGDSDKAARLDDALQNYQRNLNQERFTARVSSVTLVGTEEVYDVQVPGAHTFDANGLLAHNCGEQPLIPYESCNLGSINLESFVTVASDLHATLDYDRLKRAVHGAVHFLDNVIDANHYPIPEIAEVTRATRKIGLGVMGFARMLFRLGVGYGSEESLRLSEEIFSFIDYHSKVASIELSKARGAFPARVGHEAESDAYFERVLGERDAQSDRHVEARYADLIPAIAAHGIRNSTTTTIAPTGTISIIADTSGGCEPVFALAFKRWQADTHMVEVDQVFMAHAQANGYDSPDLMEAVEANHGSLDGLGGFRLPTSALETFVTAHDITPREHVLIQSAFQKFNDSATSKTINFAEDASIEDVEVAYALAWQSGCKGITIYRNNSRQHQPLSTPPKVENLPDRPRMEMTTEQAMAALGVPRTRSEDLYGFTRVTMTGEGKLYTTVNYDEQGIREVVTNVGRSGGTLNSLSEAIGRVISLALQYNVPVDEIAAQLIGIRGANPTGFGPKQVLSIPDAIGKVLKDSPRELNSILTAQPMFHPSSAERLEAMMVAAPRLEARYGVHAVEVYGESPECPECGHSLEFGEGCAVCRGCGFSRCS